MTRAGHLLFANHYSALTSTEAVAPVFVLPDASSGVVIVEVVGS